MTFKQLIDNLNDLRSDKGISEDTPIVVFGFWGTSRHILSIKEGPFEAYVGIHTDVE